MEEFRKEQKLKAVKMDKDRKQVFKQWMVRTTQYNSKRIPMIEKIVKDNIDDFEAKTGKIDRSKFQKVLTLEDKLERVVKAGIFNERTSKDKSQRKFFKKMGRAMTLLSLNSVPGFE